MHLEPLQWAFGAAAGLLIGITKTGIPGAGILVVSLLAAAFGGRPSIGIMLPMLIFADLFAVAWYRRHAHWDKLLKLLPWVVVGLALGAVALWATGEAKSKRDIIGTIIGWLTLVMLVLHLARGRLGERMTPTSRPGVAVTGVAAGFTTTISNAAGAIMSIHMAAQNVTKQQFIGTLAWYFLIVNVSKLPIYIVLTRMNPKEPIITGYSLILTACFAPAILAGVFVGKWVLPRISQAAFEGAVLVLAGAAGIKLIIG